MGRSSTAAVCTRGGKELCLHLYQQSIDQVLFVVGQVSAGLVLEHGATAQPRIGVRLEPEALALRELGAADVVAESLVHPIRQPLPQVRILLREVLDRDAMGDA